MTIRVLQLFSTITAILRLTGYCYKNEFETNHENSIHFLADTI